MLVLVEPLQRAGVDLPEAEVDPDIRRLPLFQHLVLIFARALLSQLEGG
jgi:hypothetical protein